MGHLLPTALSSSLKWQQVVGLLEGGASTERVATASAQAAETALARAASDPVFAETIWLLTNVPLAARAPDYIDELADLGVRLDQPPSLIELTAALSSALDRHARETGRRSDLGEMAQMALVESLANSVEPQLPSLFAPEPRDVRQALARLSQGDRFAALARDFFSRLIHRCLDYYLSRELANHVGAERRFATDADRRVFDEALALHCFEASRIVEDYAGGWYGKTVWHGDGLSREATGRFASYAFKKIRDELGRRRNGA